MAIWEKAHHQFFITDGKKKCVIV
uniref:Uncharacterized protein n=1 Tax=Arundo donax TaxID=35708 RepID=A0A0A8ZN18_ARUDO